MNILYLGIEDKRIIDFLEKDNKVIVYKERISNGDVLKDIDYIISYGYRFIISKEIVDRFKNRAINLHISYLPWNKGADPNLWSFLEDTPKGVSIHYIDYNLDTGDILGQAEIKYEDNDTLRSTYDLLTRKMEELFFYIWEDLQKGNIIAKKQAGTGSYHNSNDKNKYLFLLNEGWDTRVRSIIGKGKEQKHE